MAEQTYTMQQVEQLVRLVKKGDASSLIQLRQKLGKTQKDIALKIGVSEDQLERWEKGEEQPSRKNHAQWKLKLSVYIDEVISDLLGTDDAEINTQFWELIWRLTD